MCAIENHKIAKQNKVAIWQKNDRKMLSGISNAS